MSRGVTLELPFPPRELSPNARAFWRIKAYVVRGYRQDCGWDARAQGIPKMKPPVVADVEFVVPDRRRRDQDNLLASLKPAWDGLTDAGVLEDDSADKFSIGRVSVRVGKPSCVVVTLKGVSNVGEAGRQHIREPEDKQTQQGRQVAVPGGADVLREVAD